MNVRSFFSRKFLLSALLILWVIFSVGYIGWNLWNNYRNQLGNQAYLQGVTDTVNGLIKEAEKDGCQPVSVYNQQDKKEIKLINIKCVTDQE